MWMCLTVCEFNNTDSSDTVTACYPDGQAVLTTYGYNEVRNSQHNFVDDLVKRHQRISHCFAPGREAK